VQQQRSSWRNKIGKLEGKGTDGFSLRLTRVKAEVRMESMDGISAYGLRIVSVENPVERPTAA
jgi:hypothetical protein